MKFAAYKNKKWICDVEAEDEKDAFKKVPDADEVTLVSESERGEA